MTREHNWADNYTFSAGRIHRPASVDEVRRLVARSPRIRAIGARHSFNGVADSPGDLVDLGDIDPDFLIDPERRTVTVGGATNYGAAGAFPARCRARSRSASLTKGPALAALGLVINDCLVPEKVGRVAGSAHDVEICGCANDDSSAHAILRAISAASAKEPIQSATSMPSAIESTLRSSRTRSTSRSGCLAKNAGSRGTICSRANVTGEEIRSRPVSAAAGAARGEFRFLGLLDRPFGAFVRSSGLPRLASGRALTTAAAAHRDDPQAAQSSWRPPADRPEAALRRRRTSLPR
jgi:hypothetical protein